MYNALRTCHRFHATRLCYRLVSTRSYSSQVPPIPPSPAPTEGKKNGGEKEGTIKFTIDPSIHDDNYIVGSPTNTRNYGKIKDDSELARVLNDVLPKPPKFDDEVQTGMNYNDRIQAKLKKINTMYKDDEEAKHQAVLQAHNQVEEEIKTELIREFQFDPVEHKKYQEQQKQQLNVVSTTAYTIPSIAAQKEDSAPRKETSEGFSFGSINYSGSSITMDSEKKGTERQYVVGHHGKKLQIPNKDDIVVVGRK